jgi:hypothetical protein
MKAEKRGLRKQMNIDRTKLALGVIIIIGSMLGVIASVLLIQTSSSMHSNWITLYLLFGILMLIQARYGLLIIMEAEKHEH